MASKTNIEGPRLLFINIETCKSLTKKQWKNGSPTFIYDQEEWSHIKAICVDPTSSSAFGGFDSVTLAYIVIN